jgi:acetoin utilization deacetylase AcuC-like enzyme
VRDQPPTGVAFCAINGLALAARAVLDAGAKRVLIIDTDAHCGGGTYSLVCGWPEVTHLDVAVSEFDSYEPERNTPSTLDIVTDASAYLPTLHSRLSALDGEPFDLVLLGAGVDCHQSNGGPRGVTYQLLAEREAMIFSWAAARAVAGGNGLQDYGGATCYVLPDFVSDPDWLLPLVIDGVDM